MLIGEFQHNIDPRGRINVPSKFKLDLGDRFIVTKGLDNCLFAYSLDEWSRLEEKIKALPLARSRDLQRFLFSGATEVEMDKQGRVLIPGNLRTYASLEKDVMVIGASVRAEIWDKDKWTDQANSITADMVAEAMDDLGF